MHSVMFDVVNRLYSNGKIGEKYLDVAISLDWITVKEKQKIINLEGLKE